MSVLEEICARKAEHVEAQKTAQSLEDLKVKITEQPAPRGFIQRLKNVGAQGIALITEVKKASPSKGIIREDFDPAAIAKIYEDSGAACLSVLTDTPYFQGTDDDFIAARKAVSLPMIRKDFMINEYQIYESRVMGADCILLIMAALSDSKAKDLYDLSTELGMDVLVEIHDENELQRAIEMNPEMIGVNNRNLKTLDVNVQTSHDLLAQIPGHITKISESGLKDFETVSALQKSGYAGFLVGESLMREEDIAAALHRLIGKDLTHKEN